MARAARSAAIGFSRTGGSTIDVIAADATCRSVGPIQDQGQRHDDVRQGRELVRAAGSAAESPGAGETASRCGTNVWRLRRSPSRVRPRTAPVEVRPPSELDLGPGRSRRRADRHKDTSGLCPASIPADSTIEGGTIVDLARDLLDRWRRASSAKGTGGSIFTVANETDAKPTVAASTWGGGVNVYNSKLPTFAAGAFALNGNAPTTLKIKALHAPSGTRTAIYNNIVIFQDRTVATDMSASTGRVNHAARRHRVRAQGPDLAQRERRDVDPRSGDRGHLHVNGGGGTLKVLRGHGR